MSVHQSDQVRKEMYDRILQMTTARGELLVDDMGDCMFWPKGYPGYLTSWELRILADILDDKTKAYSDENH